MSGHWEPQAASRLGDPGTERLAVALSMVFSPLAFVTLYLITMAVGRGVRAPWPLLEAWAGLAVVPAACILGGLYYGVWSDIEVSRLPERHSLLWLISLVYAALLWVSWVTAWPPFLRHTVIALLALAIVSAPITRHWKISLHASSAGSVAGLWLIQMGLGAGVAGCLVAVALAWARVRLRRHTVAQVVAGTALGFTIAVLATLL